MSTSLIAFLVLLALFNALVSASILATRGFSGSQKILQIAVVWLLPAVGAVVCLAMVTTLGRQDAGSQGSAYADGAGGSDVGGLHAGTHGAASCDFGGGDAGGCDGGGGDGGGGD